MRLNKEHERSVRSICWADNKVLSVVNKGFKKFTPMFRKYISYITASILLVIFSSFMEERGQEGGSVYISPLTIVPCTDRDILYIADFTGNRVIRYNTVSRKPESNIPLKGAPSGMCLSGDARFLYVTCGVSPGMISIVNLDELMVERIIYAGHSPVAPVLGPDGKFLYVADLFNHCVLKLDLGNGEVKSRIPVIREPVSAVMDQTGSWLFVANHLPDGPANGDFISCEMSVINLDKECIETHVILPNGSNSLKGITLSPDGKFIYISHLLAKNQLPTTHLERGWMNTNVVSIIETLNFRYMSTVVLDDIDRGAANPWGLICSPDGKYLCVAISGTNEVILIDRNELHRKLKGLGINGSAGSLVEMNAVASDLTFLNGLKMRIRLEGKGPRGLAVKNSVLYVAEYYSGTIAEIDLSAENQAFPPSVSLGVTAEPDLERLGEIYFHDATRSFQMWLSCASCHPGDGRVDALNWDLLNDGFGNPKSTKNLLLAHQTPPAMISGIRPDAETGVRAGLMFIEFVNRPEKDAEALDKYLGGLQPVPSPFLKSGELSEGAKKGQKLFRKAGCAICHRGDYYTNLRAYDVGTGFGKDLNMKFDTPTLVEVWRSAPYLNDGRAATMKEVITTFNQENRHGKTKKLSEPEIEDLAEYVLSL